MGSFPDFVSIIASRTMHQSVANIKGFEQVYKNQSISFLVFFPICKKHSIFT